METDQQYIDEVVRQFGALQSVSDLAALLNFVYRHIHPENHTPIYTSSLTYYGNYKLAPNRYVSFTIPKKGGGERLIYSPVPVLKKIQRALAEVFGILYKPSAYCIGFVKGKNIVCGARRHVGMRYVYNLDLKDYFPSIHIYRIKKCLMLPPFSLTGEEREKLAYLIANLCCFSPDGTSVAFLPQGAPTSPVLSNIVAATLDRRLHGVAGRYGLKYTRYADDITFSALTNRFRPGSACVQEINRIIAEQHFCVNTAKTHLAGKAYRQMVTGVVVNTKPNVPQKCLAEVRSWLYLWDRYGYKAAQAIFQSRYASSQLVPKAHVPELHLVLRGKLLYFKMVRGEDDAVYKRLEARFTELKKKLIKPLKHRPAELSHLLREMFCAENESLKYATHRWDKGECSYQMMLNGFSKALHAKYASSLKVLDEKLFAKIYAFIDTENENGLKTQQSKNKKYWWGKHKLTFGWRTMELKNWCLAHPDASPFDYCVQHPVCISGRSYTTFEEVVMIFKREIECRKDQNQLKEILTGCKKILIEKDFQVELNCPPGIGFYTNMERLERALERMFYCIARFAAQSLEVRIEVTDRPKTVEIQIIHKDSVCNMQKEDLAALIHKGDFGKIYQELISVADWKIQVQLPDKTCAEYRFLQTEKEGRLKEIIGCPGFVHVLTLYKS